MRPLRRLSIFRKNTKLPTEKRTRRNLLCPGVGTFCIRVCFLGIAYALTCNLGGAINILKASRDQRTTVDRFLSFNLLGLVGQSFQSRVRLIVLDERFFDLPCLREQLLGSLRLFLRRLCRVSRNSMFTLRCFNAACQLFACLEALLSEPALICPAISKDLVMGCFRIFGQLLGELLVERDIEQLSQDLEPVSSLSREKRFEPPLGQEDNLPKLLLSTAE